MALTPIDRFIQKEKEYYGGRFIIDHFKPVMEKYDLAYGDNYWVTFDKVAKVPNVLNSETLAYNGNHAIPQLAHSEAFSLFDHFYTFVSKTGKFYWVTMPYDNGKSIEEVKDALEKNNIHPVEIVRPSPYADMLILFDPVDIARAYPK